jgi:sarcosine oxidase
MPQQFDAIVIGVGGMGSATVYELARRGEKVLGLEQFDIPHSMGSSHGLTRIIRLAYNEDPAYVPILRRAYELWRETQLKFGEQLLYVTGGLDISREGGIFSDALMACQQHNLPHEILSAQEIMRRYPAYKIPADLQAVYQPDAGFLMSERAIVAHVLLALGLGADVHAREKVISWEPAGDGVRVITDHDTYTAEKLVITAGAWASKLLEPLAPGLAIPERQILAWFQPHKPPLFELGNFPVFIMDVEDGMFYGFPVHHVPGFKLGRMHHREEVVDPDTMDREPHPADEAILRDYAKKYFPQGAGATMALRACIFTNSPDEHFILDAHPDYPQVVFGAGFSGHGFKFTSVIGEILADLALRGETRHDIGFLRLSRLLPKS